MAKQKMEWRIDGGPGLMDLERSFYRHTDHELFYVEFELEHKKDRGCRSLSWVLIQGMDRPKNGQRFWNIRASNRGISEHDFENLKYVLVYDPLKREGHFNRITE